MTRYEPFYSQDWVNRKEAIMNLLLDWGECASDSDLPVAEKKTSATVLTLAVKWAGPGLIQRLIQGGADVHARVRNCPHDLGFHSQYGYIDDITAIFIAWVYGNLNAIKILLGYRGDEIDVVDMIRSRDSRGSFPLHWAARNRSQFQMSPQERVQNAPRGADASIRNNKSETPLHTFFRGSNHKPCDTDAIATLLAHGAKVTDADDNGNTPLHLAASKLNQVDATLTSAPARRQSGYEKFEIRNAPSQSCW
ncbi:hypothetical protein FBEOM_13639 [Fusarium beomiforme]|uniref:Ankyrin repeat protein n=1 Tax=Fusarium beomiforme TaxID=44412 RepID=A0A9P5DRD5_9HYPO|nr:hypothetical protein FBEOM_13639 [Fusarium beomiforme]